MNKQITGRRLVQRMADDGLVSAPGGRGLSENCLRQENDAYAGTGGVSAQNRHAGFSPAYRHQVSGETMLSRFADGTQAPVHLLEGLPAHWIRRRDADAAIVEVLPEVIAGFLRDGIFYTREEAAVAVQAAVGCDRQD